MVSWTEPSTFASKCSRYNSGIRDFASKMSSVSEYSRTAPTRWPLVPNRFEDTLDSTAPVGLTGRRGNVSYFCVGLEEVGPSAIGIDVVDLRLRRKMGSAGNNVGYKSQSPDVEFTVGAWPNAGSSTS